MDAQFVSADDLETLADYAGALVAGMLTIRTLETFHNQAVKKGILDSDEIEMAKTIAWELTRLMGLYRQQTTAVLSRTDIEPSELIQSFHNASLAKAKDLIKKNKKEK